MQKESSKNSKTDVLKIEKRVIELELAIGELKEHIQGIDVSMIPDLKQKVEDLEDLIMVEQAGILELKKLLEESKPEKPEKPIPEDLEQRLVNIESSIPNLVEKTELESRLENIQKDLSSQVGKPTSVEIEGLYNRLTRLETNLSVIKSQTDNISKELYEKIKEISLKTVGVKQPTIDFDLLASKIEAGKSSIDELYKKKIELDLKIAEITKKMEILESKMEKSPRQELVDGLKLNRKEIVATNARIDSLERVARELMVDVQNFEKIGKKFESLEKISLLSKNIEEKLERSKFIEEEVKKLTSKIEMIYNEIDKRVEKVRGMNNRLKAVEEIKMEMVKERELITNLSKEIDKNKERIENLHKETKEKIEPFVEKIDRLSNEYKNFVEETSKRIAYLENIKPTVEKRLKEIKVDEINRILTDITMKIPVIESRIASIETDYEKKIEEFRSAVREKLVEIRAPSFLDDQVKEIVNRIVFLESRLMGIENMIQKKSEALPIIIE